MTLMQFLARSRPEQFQFLRNYGVQLAHRSNDDGRFYLYTSGAFYIELLYCDLPEGGKDLRIVRAFESTAPLEVYLQQINIDPLLQLLA